MRHHPRNSLLHALCLSALGPFATQAQWTVADTSGAVQVLSVSPIGSTGYLATSDPWYRSADAGQTWTTYTPTYTIGGLPYAGIWRGAQFRGGDTVLVWGGWDFDNGYTIGRSLNGGYSWAHMLNNTAGPILRGLRDMHFPVPSRGYSVGNNGRVFRTFDGGIVWGAVTFPGTQDLYSVHFADPLVGVVAGNGVFKRTSDPLLGWTDVAAPAGSYRLDGQGAQVVACGPNVTLTSSDGGATWTTYPSPLTLVSRVYMIDPQHVLAITTNKAYSSTDGGLSWEQVVLPVNPVVINDICFLSPQNGCLVGQITGPKSMILTTGSGVGAGIPMPLLSTTLLSAACGSKTYELQAIGVHPSWTLTWLRDGNVIGTGPTVQVTYTAPGAAGIVLQANNGTHTGTVAWSTAITVDQPFTLTTSPDVVVCAGQGTSLSATGPAGTTYSWSPATGLSSTNSPTPTVSGLTSPITYTVTGTMGLCTATAQVLVDMQPPIPEVNWITLRSGSQQFFHHFPDAYHGYHVSSVGVWRTADGGHSWELRSSPLGAANIHMADAMKGYLYAGNSVWTTTDGWTTSSLTNVQADLIRSRNADTLFLYRGSGTQRFLRRSVDGGINWSAPIALPNGTTISDFAFLHGGVVLACGFNGPTSKMYRSTDHGSTWTEVVLTAPMGQLSDLEVASDGSIHVLSNNRLHRSVDQGLTWEQVLSQGSLGGVAFMGPDTGFARIGTALRQTVNGSACWQVMAPPFIEAEQIQAVEDRYVSIKGAAGGGYVLYRNRLPPPGLRFTLARDTVCAGSGQSALNNSHGYTAYQWWLNGSLIGTATHPTLPVLPPGDHTLMLVGTHSLGTDTVTHVFHVQEFTDTPVLSFLPFNCWATDTVPIHASTAAPHLGHQWYRVTGGGPQLVGYGGDVLQVSATGGPYTYVARAISTAGCLGDLSAPITTPVIPRVTQPMGPWSFCNTGTPSTYTTNILLNTPVIAFAWDLVPANAGTLTPSGASCTVNWDPGFTGNFSIQVQGLDTCGPGPAATLNGTISPGTSILQQPQPVSVNVGQPFTLQVVTNGVVTSSGWYHNGNPVGGVSFTYSVAQATLADAGTYYWRQWLGSACGYLTSDTVLVTVGGSVGLEEGASTDGGLVLWPNPSPGMITLRVAALHHDATVVVHDASGRLVHQENITAGPTRAHELRLDHAEPGVYRVRLIGPDGTGSASVVIQR